MSTKLSYFYTFIFSAIFAMLLFDGFYYMTLFNMIIEIDFITDILLKGFIVGFFGALVFSMLKFKGFVPFGWLGALVGLQLTDFVFALTPYGSFYEEGTGYVMTVMLDFLITLIAGSVLYYILSKVIKVGRGSGEKSEAEVEE